MISKEALFVFFSTYGALRLLKDIYFLFIEKYFTSDEERFWESHPFEDTLEKADDLCEIGNTFQRNEIIYKEIDKKKWLAEILIPDGDEFEIGYDLKIENYIYKKNW